MFKVKEIEKSFKNKEESRCSEVTVLARALFLR